MSATLRIPMPGVRIIRHEAVRYGPWDLDYANKEVDLSLARRRKIRAMEKEAKQEDGPPDKRAA